MELGRNFEQQAYDPRAAHPRFSISLAPGAAAIVDVFVIFVAAYFASRYFIIITELNRDQHVFAVLFVAVVSLALFQRAGLYELDAIMRPIRFSDAVIAGLVTSFLFFFSIVFSLKVADVYSLQWVIAFAGGAIIGVGAGRFFLFMALRRLGRLGQIGRNLVVLGAGEQARRFLERLDAAKPFFTALTGVYADDAERGQVAGRRIIGDSTQLLSDVRAGLIDDVVIAMPWNEDVKLVRIVERIKELPVNVHISSDLVGFRLQVRPVLGADAQLSLFEVERKPISGWSSLLKLVEDYLLASIALLILSPLLILAAIAIKIDDPSGPVFFMQKRLGFNNREFEIYKFRSMFHDRGPEAEVKQATKHDPRVTRVGRLIRATSIDELPQLLNVLNGTMSLVGPRPHALSHNEEYGRQIRGYFTRHKVKPGITGWAQVNGLRGETEALEKMEARINYDVYYAENWSLLFDIRILIQTVVVIFFQKSAY